MCWAQKRRSPETFDSEGRFKSIEWPFLNGSNYYRALDVGGEEDHVLELEDGLPLPRVPSGPSIFQT